MTSVEIERRFKFDPSKVTKINVGLPLKCTRIFQVYLRGIGRLRFTGGSLVERTIKRHISGYTAHETTDMISFSDAVALIKSNDVIGYVHKLRYQLPANDGLMWELDYFIDSYTDNLCIAEIELPSESTDVILPEFITDEVTGDMSLSNLAQSIPFDMGALVSVMDYFRLDALVSVQPHLFQHVIAQSK